MPPNFIPDIQQILLKILVQSFHLFYGTLTLYGITFQKTSTKFTGFKNKSYNTTCLLHYCNRFGLPYVAFSLWY